MEPPRGERVYFRRGGIGAVFGRARLEPTGGQNHLTYMGSQLFGGEVYEY
jgi:hypothetical protein